MCNCIGNANRQLRDTGHELTVARIGRAGEKQSEPRALLRAASIDPMRRGRGPTVLATHCPWCGEKYGSAA